MAVDDPATLDLGRLDDRLGGRLLLGEPGVDRDRGRDLDEHEDVDAPAPVGGDLQGGAQGVGVELVLVEDDEHRVVLDLPVGHRPGGLDPRGGHQVEPLPAPVDDVDADAEEQPADPGEGDRGVERGDGEEGQAGADTAEHGEQRELAAANPEGARAAVGPLAVGLLQAQPDVAPKPPVPAEPAVVEASASAVKRPRRPWILARYTQAMEESGWPTTISQTEFDAIQARKPAAMKLIEGYLKAHFGSVDPTVMTAFEEVPREYYHYMYADHVAAPAEAYETTPKPWAIGYGSALSDYLGQAYMTQLLNPKPGMTSP